MSQLRYSGASATLASGPVVIGGLGVLGAVASSEQYNVATNTWTLTAGATGAVNQTATVLPSGDLFVAGGNTGPGATTAAQPYGTCSNSLATDGTVCNSGNLCTTGDSCQAGVCLPGENSGCQASDWTANTLYKQGDTVAFGGLVYGALKVNVSKVDVFPFNSPAIWRPLGRISGETISPPVWYPNGAQYAIGDHVTYNGAAYHAIEANVSTPETSPVASPALWLAVSAIPDGTLGANCLPPTTMEPISHCNNGLGCNWTTNTCTACGGMGQPCCDGSRTPFAGVCYATSYNDATCPVCSAGACDSNTHVCSSCGTSAGSACCAPDASSAVAFCPGQGLTCNWSNGAMTAGTCANCGSINAQACPDGTCEKGLHRLDDNSCSAESPDLTPAWISANVKGPLTLQTKQAGQSFTCQTFSGYFGVPCPSNLLSSSAPRWAPGDGFTITDGTKNVTNENPLISATIPAIYVPQQNITLHANVSFTDDTSATETTMTAVFGPPPLSAVHTLIPGMLEGNHAHYNVTVQSWVNGATCPNPATLPSVDPDNGIAPVHLDTSPVGPPGCWEDLASGQTDLYGSSYGFPSATIAVQDQSVSQTIDIPVTLPNWSDSGHQVPGVATYIRYVTTVSETDTRVSSDVIGWTNPSDLLGGPVFPPDYPTNTTCAFYNKDNPDGENPCYFFQINRTVYPGQFSVTEASDPVELIIEPLALAQVKVLPYLLMYAPPGNASSMTYQINKTYGVSLTYDNKLTNNASNAVDNKNTISSSIGLTGSVNIGSFFGTGGPGGAGMGGMFTALGAGVSGGQNMAGFDTSTNTQVGSIQDVNASDTAVSQNMMSWSVKTFNTTPGANGTAGNEPWSNDEFFVIVHPQVGLWQLGGQPVVSLLAARGTLSNPFLGPIHVTDLQTCVQTGSLALMDNSDVLTADDCQQLLKLDPLVTNGQRYPALIPDMTNTGNPRYVFDTQASYGIRPGDGGNAGAEDVYMFSNTSTDTAQRGSQTAGSYQAAITDILTTNSTAGASLSLFGIGASLTLSDTETMTNSTTWNVTLQSTYSAYAQSSVTFSGTLDDKHGMMGTQMGPGLPYQPTANIYRDLVFGSFLFQDPTAPDPPLTE